MSSFFALITLCASTALSPCPSSPNCVNSQCKDGRHEIEPFPYKESAIPILEKLLLKHFRAQVVTVEKDYLHVTVKTALFRFTDDLEFLVDHEHQLIHVRSASRIGHYDFGTNRRRVERLRKLFNKARDYSR